jgi:hypothetical protein
MAQSNTSRAQTTHQAQSSSSPSKKPVDKFTDGPVHVSIWENQGVKNAFRTASIELRYKFSLEKTVPTKRARPILR